jgi:tyrosyl-tRNA synthetase
MNLFRGAPKVSVDEEKISELLSRGVERVYPTPDWLKTKLLSGDRLSLYLGIDPTAETLHLGHAAGLLKLRAFQELGHDVIVLLGGFTAQIGDPTDKLSARQPLSAGQVKRNARSYRALIGKILNVKKANIRFLDNERWTNKLRPVDLVRLASRFTVSQILERDMFQERIKQGKEIHLHELLYPVFQAYDAVTMGVDLQIGGNDQTFNMLAGRTLARKLKNKEVAVMSLKLLVDPASGKKMGKTENNMVALDDEPGNMFGKIMSWPDGMIAPGFELCTTAPLAEIEAIKKELAAGANPKDSKMKLAEAVVSLLHGSLAAAEARENFNAAFTLKTPREFLDIPASGADFGDTLVALKVVVSKSELRRLIAEGAVSHLDSGVKVGEEFLKTPRPGKYRVGKHRFIKIIAS